MPDVNLTVMVDGKTVFAHGAIGAPEPYTPVLAGLMAATAHFQAVARAAMIPPPNSNSGAGQPAATTEQKGPTL